MKRNKQIEVNMFIHIIHRKLNKTQFKFKARARIPPGLRDILPLGNAEGSPIVLPFGRGGQQKQCTNNAVL